MVQIDIAYRGQLRCEAVHQPSSTGVNTDAPVDNQGLGESFSPTDLLATALGTCMLTIMGITAKKRGWALEGSTAQVTKHMVADPARRVGRLDVHISVPTEFDEPAREALLAAARDCPVTHSVSDRIDVSLEVSWGGESAGA